MSDKQPVKFLKYIELVRTKSEALDHIYRLFKQNIKSGNASGEGNAGERWKTTIGLISKKATLHAQQTFFLRPQRETCWNFLVTRFIEEMSYVFSFTFFSLPLIFTLHWWPLAFLILSTPLLLEENSNKKCLLCFSSLALDLCLPISRWASLACRLLSLSLCLSLALYSKFVVMTIILSLILKKIRIQRQFPLFDFLVVSASQDAGGHAISRQNNLEMHLGCHTRLLSYFTLVCLWCALLLALRARELRYYQFWSFVCSFLFIPAACGWEFHTSPYKRISILSILRILGLWAALNCMVRYQWQWS